MTESHCRATSPMSMPRARSVVGLWPLRRRTHCAKRPADPTLANLAISAATNWRQQVAAERQALAVPCSCAFADAVIEQHCACHDFTPVGTRTAGRYVADLDAGRALNLPPEAGLRRVPSRLARTRRIGVDGDSDRVAA